MDEVEIQLGGRENSRISFTGKLNKLVPGRNEVSVFCPVSCDYFLLRCGLLSMLKERSVLSSGHVQPIQHADHDVSSTLPVETCQDSETDQGGKHAHACTGPQGLESSRCEAEATSAQ